MKLHTVRILKGPNYTTSVDNVPALVVPNSRSPFRDTIIGGSFDVNYRILVDPDVDLDPRDVIEWNGRRYIVEGGVIKVPDPLTGDIHHLEAGLKDYEMRAGS